MDHTQDGQALSQRPPIAVAPIPLDPDTGAPYIRKLFIANRGEIACRVISTCRKLQIRTVVIYVTEDEMSRHVSEADEAILLGSMESHTTNPFLNVELLIKTALDSGAQAIHPGYGYLSENADFAERVGKAGLIFIGPSAGAMSTLGDKRSSKQYLSAKASDVPLIPGFSGSSTQIHDLEKAAADIGYPIMLKASAGGGGKGMRIVRQASQLSEELARVQSEAARSFGSTDVILEKYIESSKHVEIQIVGDKHGNVLSFFERDCSVQRRHQKVIEESPCLFLSDKLRSSMGQTATRIAKLIGYENAGTVEFVVDVETSQYFFLEVNTRLQVEHPITEEVTGVDLVSVQLYVACGGDLGSLSATRQLTQSGHAIECRLCAECPEKDFFPENGLISLWKPAGGLLGPSRDVRYETAIQSGSPISIYFDSMIAKLVVWAPTRDLAVQKMADLLANTLCMGVRTNQLFLQRCLLHPKFRDLRYNTSFIPQNLDQLLRPSLTEKQQRFREELIVIPSLFIRLHVSGKERGSHNERPFQNVRSHFRNQRFDPGSIQCDIVTTDWQGLGASTDAPAPQSSLSLWKMAAHNSAQAKEYEAAVIPFAHILNSASQRDLKAVETIATTTSSTKQMAIQYNRISNHVRQASSEFPQPITVKVLNWNSPSPAGQGPSPGILEVSLDGTKVVAYCIEPKASESSEQAKGQSRYILCHFPILGTFVRFQKDTLLSYMEGYRTSAEDQSATQGHIKAPMPCKVLSIPKSQGEEVRKGEIIMVIESMKMEVSLKASVDGRFETPWKVGDAVAEEKVLCRVV
ncbi:unnamed protein product [Clonostachys rosea f. rosea IK726]|uniref:Uncharacterized protein n=1 Tax=Clonostachys rosea f. rosea IK726 TaxID=1349383 RepID=A0ACA9T681_BIOOC|nr:unnamed protein product [Clonostachys rosea f. rosea IK726]